VGSTSRHWQERVTARSLARAAASPGDRRSVDAVSRRALRPALRLVAATVELVDELESSSFTVQDVLDRAGISLQTFYRHFAGKDELLLAVLEEIVTDSSEEFQRYGVASNDPVVNLEQVVKGPFIYPRPPGIARWTLREHMRLLEDYADEVRRADLPFADALTEKIEAAQTAGRFPGVGARVAAELINDFVRVRYHVFTLGLVERTAEEEAEEIWQFCLAALTRNEARPEPVSVRNSQATDGDGHKVKRSGVRSATKPGHLKGC